MQLEGFNIPGNHDFHLCSLSQVAVFLLSQQLARISEVEKIYKSVTIIYICEEKKKSINWPHALGALEETTITKMPEHPFSSWLMRQEKSKTSPLGFQLYKRIIYWKN